MERLDIIFIIIMIFPLFIAVYLMLPGVYIALKKNALSVVNDTENDELLEKVFRHLPFPQMLKQHILLLLHEADLGNIKTWMYWALFTTIMPVIVAVIMIVNKFGFFAILIITSACIVLPDIYLKTRAVKRQKAFILCAYKLYYFLHSQITSGIKATDAVKSLHEIADHPLINKTFMRFVSHYELSLDIDEALSIISNSFRGYDCQMLCCSIRQAINTGFAGKTLQKMEQHMFSKYFFLMQKETAKYRTQLLISGLFAIVPVIVLFTGPIVYSAFAGFKDVFSGTFI